MLTLLIDPNFRSLRYFLQFSEEKSRSNRIKFVAARLGMVLNPEGGLQFGHLLRLLTASGRLR